MAVVIDTDGDADDAVALWWALEHLDVLAVTVVQGRRPNPAARVADVLTAAGRTDVAVGDAGTIASAPDGTDLVGIGPLTTIAAALRLDDSLPSRLGRVVLMGGPVERDEFNFTHDPAATTAVLAAGWPSLTVVGLDRTEDAVLSDGERALLDERRTPAAAYLADEVRARDRPIHDLVAVLELTGGDFHDAVQQLFS